MRRVTFNGKFYCAGMNGVHRVADRLIHACDAELAAMDPRDRPAMRVLAPATRRWPLKLDAIAVEDVAGATGQKWEQTGLPRLARDDVLVNLANLAPVLHRPKLTLIHDAQFLFPDSSYPARQRIGYRHLMPRIARSSARVMTVSDYSRQMLDVLGVCPRAASETLYNGADHALQTAADPGTLDRLGLERERYVVLFGSPKAYKNNQVVFDAFADGDVAGCRLVVIGAARAKLEAAGLRIPAAALFVTDCDDATLRALYTGAHCLVFPSRTEGFGLPPVEAMLCGCPVVAAPAGAVPEVCRDAVLYADVDDAAAWRAHLAEPALRDRKIAAGSARAAAFTWKAAGSRLMAAILELARR